jgi:4-hydroxy-4-methyl-2-oxoglutarate aldolase
MNSEKLSALLRLGAATVYEAQGQKGALDAGMKALDPSARLIGPALTVDTRPADNLMIHHAVRKAKRGDVLVVDAKGFIEAGPWGDVLTLAAQTQGIAGLVIDGSIRDAETIISMGFPVFSRGISIKGTGKAQHGRINVPVQCGGVTINPGDIILGDRDGLVVINLAEIDAVLNASRERERKEDIFRKEIESGKTTVELLGLAKPLESMDLR